MRNRAFVIIEVKMLSVPPRNLHLKVLSLEITFQSQDNIAHLMTERKEEVTFLTTEEVKGGDRGIGCTLFSTKS